MREIFLLLRDMHNESKQRFFIFLAERSETVIIKTTWLFSRYFVAVKKEQRRRDVILLIGARVIK